MTLSTALIARLHDGAAIEAVMGKRWYPGRLIEKPVFPAGTYQRITGVGGHTHDGLITPRERRYQLSIYDTDYTRGDDARVVVIAELAGTRATWGTETVTCRLADDAEDIDPQPGGLYRQRVDLYLTSTAA